MKPVLFLSWTLLLTVEVKAKKQRQTPTSSGVVDARLVNGAQRCSGYLEMKHEGQWRTLKSRYSTQWSGGFAHMACRQMGCGSLVSYKVHSNTTVSRPAWEVNFYCHDAARSIRECREKESGNTVENIESTLSSIYVECSEYLRVSEKYSSMSCHGNVMMKSGQSWIHVCESKEAKNQEMMMRMMCAVIGCGNPANTHTSGRTMEEPAVESRIIRCHGNETRINECPTIAQSNCRRVLYLSCQETISVRLVGPSRCTGVVEGKKERQWRPLVHRWYMFNNKQDMALCNAVGCGTIVSSYSVNLNQDISVWEPASECDSSNKLCTYWRDSTAPVVINMVCSESVKLVDGPDSCSGFVEVKHESGWRRLCRDGFTPLHSFVGCRDVGCGFPGNLRPKRVLEAHDGLRLNCSGHEEKLVHCPESSRPAGGSNHTCNAAFLSCRRSPIAPEVSLFSRLADVHPQGIVVHRGHRLFVTCSVDSLSRVRSFRLRFYNGGYMTLWQNQSAVDNKAQFVFESVDQSHVNSYYCSYDYEFRPNVFSEATSFFLKVKKSSYVRLVGGASRCLGRVELQSGEEWRPVSQQLWSGTEASVVCRQLDCGSAIDLDSQTTALKPVWSFYSDCEEGDSALLSCGSVREGLSSTTVTVLCSDILDPPSITVLADGLYPKTTERVIVHEGHGFFLNCSVNATFPGGRFLLDFSGPENLLNVRKSETEYSAVFTFSQVRKEHSGNYSCVYHNTVARQNFSFHSPSVTVSVEEFNFLMLDDGRQREADRRSCSGTLLLSDGTSQMKMVAAERSGWDSRLASIACRQLRCGKALSASRVQLHTFRSTWRFFSDCDGTEEALLDCGHIQDWFSSSVVRVECAGNS